MRRFVLSALLFCSAQASFASDPIGDILYIYGDVIAEGEMTICNARDPDNAEATTKAYEHWKSVNAKVLQQLGTERDQALAMLKQRATDPKAGAKLDDRVTQYLGLYMVPLTGTIVGLHDAATRSDASLLETCADHRTSWMKNKPDMQLTDARSMLQETMQQLKAEK